MSSEVESNLASSTSLGELARLFLKLGTIAFGGPAAYVAMMENEVVRRRHWLTRLELLDYLGATNLIPGPNSTELAIHIWRSLALMVVVTWQLGHAALVDVPTIVLAAVSAVLLVRCRVNSAWLVLGGAMLGLLASGLGRV